LTFLAVRADDEYDEEEEEEEAAAAEEGRDEEHEADAVGPQSYTPGLDEGTAVGADIGADTGDCGGTNEAALKLRKHASPFCRTT